MTKRTQKEIEADVKRLKEASQTATSLAQLSIATGLSYSMINTTLSKHPIIFKRIKTKLEENAELELQKQEAEKQAKLELQEREAEKQAKLELQKKKAQKSISGYVIDASITGIENLEEILSKLCLSRAKLILTSITIDELNNLQTRKDIKGKDSRHILALCAENPNNVETVLIDETLENHDACIIKYCTDNKDQVTLLTADKHMALKARARGVQVQYFKQTYNYTHPTTTHRYQGSNNSKIRTLIPAKRIGAKLFISDFNTNTLSICIHSNGKVYNDGVVELHIGDDIFISSKKDGYITFAHYRMVSLFTKNNCRLIYSTRIYDYNNFDVPKKAYKSFLNDFKLRHDL